MELPAAIFDWVLLIPGVMILLTLWLAYRRLFDSNRCPNCRRGKLQEAKAKTLDVKQHMYHGSSENIQSTIQSIVEVEYRCNRCGEHLTVTENR